MKPTISSSLLVLIGALACASCSVTSPSGFLGNFDQLDAGFGTTDAVASYVAPDTDITQYKALIIDPVTTVFADPEISPEVASQLAAYTQEALIGEFGKHIALTATPGPSVLRLRSALSDVISGTEIQGDPVTTKHMAPRATLDGTIGDETIAKFVSKVSFEAELIDAGTDQRIGALVDHRLGNRLGKKREATSSTSWAAVKSAASMGVKKLAKRFTLARGE